MNAHTDRNVTEDMIYLARCAVNGEIPAAERLEGLDLAALYQAADRQMMTSVVGMALESAGVMDPAFQQAEAGAIRKNVCMDVELGVLSARLAEAGIWYMPLKGALMKDYYPRIGMRQMTDYDILFDASRAQDVREIMLSLGYTVVEYGIGHHDEYSKLPFYHFEMHRVLFVRPDDREVFRYYRDVKSRLLPDERFPMRYRFSTEDFYIYLLAHEHKHYTGAGIGLRPTLDIYVCQKRFGEQMDHAYIAGELEKLGLTEFERQSRELAMALYGDGELTDAGRQLLDRHILSGAFGSMEQRVDNALERMGGGSHAKFLYVFRRFFIPREIIPEAYPFFWRHKILLPFLLPYRIIRGLLVHWPRLRAEFSLLFKRKENE